MKQIETAQAFSATSSQVKPCDSLPTWPLGPALQVWSNEAVAKSCGLTDPWPSEFTHFLKRRKHPKNPKD